MFSDYKYGFNFSLLVSCFILFTSCEEDVEGVSTQSSGASEDIVEGFVVDYFYDLANESVDAKFLHYRKAEGLWPNTISDTTKIDITRDTINFRTYNEFRLKVPESEIESYNDYVWFDETRGGSCLAESGSCIDIDFRNSQGKHYVIDDFSKPVLEDDGSEDGTDPNWSGFQTSAAGCVSPSNDGIGNDASESGSPYACYDLEQSGEYEVFSGQYTSIEKIIWDIEGSRYKTYLDTTFIHYEDPDDLNSDFTQSQWEYASVDVVLGQDTPTYTYDSLIYMANINDFISPDTGIFYLDTLEFIKTSFLYTSDDIEIFQQFTFDNMNALGQDSMMYRISTDCNQNGQVDVAEPMNNDFNLDGDMVDILDESVLQQDYCGDNGDVVPDGNNDDICYEFSDLGNGVQDGPELYYDLNGNGRYDSTSELGAEPFEDLNCNGVYDYSEVHDYNNNGNYGDTLDESVLGQDYCGGIDGLADGDIDDICIEWIDSGNGIWDADEEDDGSGLGSKVSSVPSSILFDYSTTPPSPVIEIDEFTQIERPDGSVYAPIDITTILDSVYQYVPKIDSVVTIFSNEVITHFAPDSLKDLEYIITKTNTALPSGLGYDINEYAYNIFNTENHIKELKNPSFFLPYGFYETPEAIADGFWFDECRDTLEVFLWAENGMITTADGNLFAMDTLIVNEDSDCDGDGLSDNGGNGDYNIEIDYQVEHLDSVMVKMRKILTDENGLCLGGVLHPNIEPLTVSDPEDCYDVVDGIGAAALDTMVTDCFKITKTLTMTYIGSGVEYGEKVTMWLARDLGIVKNYLDIRWSEPFWVDGEQWRPYSRWELVDLRDVDDSGLGRFAGKRRVSYDDFKDMIEFDGDPYERRRTAGLHRVKIGY